MREASVTTRELTATEAEPDGMPTLGRGLAGYVRAVAAQVGVPAEGTGFEISDTATAYLGLATRSSERPGRDLMLVWGEQHGWFVAVETGPAEPPIVVAYLGGAEVVPDPLTVARFVGDVVTGRHMHRTRPHFPTGDNRRGLAEQLNRYVVEPP